MATVQKKICMLGSFGVGKTSLVSQFVHSIFAEEYLSTIGVKIDRKSVLVDDLKVDMVIWDIAGDDRFERLHDTYLKGLSGYLLVVDGCRPETLGVAELIRETMSDQLDGVPFVCLINKQDLEAEWRIKPADIDRLVQRGWVVRKTSAKDAKSVEAAFATLAEAMVSQTPVAKAS